MKKVRFRSQNGKIAFVLTGLTKEQNSEAKKILQAKEAIIEKTAKKDGTYFIIYDPDAPETIEVSKAKAAIGTWGGFELVSYEDFITNANAITDENGFVLNGRYLFDYKGTEDSITIPSGIEEICEEAFQWNSVIKEVKCPDTLKIINNSAFYECKNLTSVELPSKLEKLGWAVFWGCSKLSFLTLPNSISEIGNGCFDRCRSLKQITVPPCIKDDKSLIDFIGREYGGKVVVSPENDYYISDDSGVYNRDKTTLFYPGTVDECTLPDSLLRLEEAYFWAPRHLKKLVIPEQVVDSSFSFFLHYSSVIEIVQCPEALVKEYYNYLSVYFKRNLPDLGYRLIGKKIITYNNEAEWITKELIKNYREEIFQLIIEKSDAEALDGYLSRLSRVTLDKMDEMIGRVGEDKTELKTILLDFKNKRFSKEDVDQINQDKLDKELGLKERSPSEWKKEFVLKNIGEDNVCIEKYKGNENAVLIPEKIGKRTVAAFNLPRFLENPVELIIPDSMIVPRSPIKRKSIVPGETVEFGQYYISENTVAPIKWRVLEVQNNEALLITDRVIEYMPYHHKRAGIYWDTSDMRKWLNSTFFGFAFAEKEQQLIFEKEHSTTTFDYRGARSVIVTKDRVFLLSKDECEQYLKTKDDRTAFATPRYCEAFKERHAFFKYEKGPEDHVDWALRSDASTGNAAIYVVGPYGEVVCGRMVSSFVEDMHGIRPAIWIRTGD